jgi:hypothetical protein
MLSFSPSIQAQMAMSSRTSWSRHIAMWGSLSVTAIAISSAIMQPSTLCVSMMDPTLSTTQFQSMGLRTLPWAVPLVG